MRRRDKPFQSGLPQGSILAPTLYKSWSADLIADLKSVPGIDTFMYANDTAKLSRGTSIE